MSATGTTLTHRAIRTFGATSHARAVGAASKWAREIVAEEAAEFGAQIASDFDGCGAFFELREAGFSVLLGTLHVFDGFLE